MATKRSAAREKWEPQSDLGKKLRLGTTDVIPDTRKASTETTLPDIGKLDHDSARVLTNKVKDDADALWTNIRRLYDGGAHVALGYPAWGDYFAAEFGKSRSYGYRLLKAAEVAEELAQATATGRFPSRPLGDSLTERQARELAKADDPHAALAAASTDGEPTAAKIKAVVSGKKENPRPVEAEVVHEQLALSFTVEAETPTEAERWKAAADDAGYPLEEWARAILNAACAG